MTAHPKGYRPGSLIEHLIGDYVLMRSAFDTAAEHGDPSGVGLGQFISSPSSGTGAPVSSLIELY